MPISHTANILALRARALALPSLVDATSDEFAVTATGYTRSDGGSFVTDGFVEGMEVVPVGFANSTPGIASAVSASTLTIMGGRTIEAEDAGRRLDVALPPLQAWEGIVFEAPVGRWWVEEDYLPGPAFVATVGPGRQLESTPLYVLKLYSPPGYGVLAPYALADALLTHFAAMTPITLSTGDVMRVRGDVAPYRGQLTVREGYALVTVTIPLRLRTANSI